MNLKQWRSSDAADEKWAHSFASTVSVLTVQWRFVRRADLGILGVVIPNGSATCDCTHVCGSALENQYFDVLRREERTDTNSAVAENACNNTCSRALLCPVRCYRLTQGHTLIFDAVFSSENRLRRQIAGITHDGAQDSS